MKEGFELARLAHQGRLRHFPCLSQNKVIIFVNIAFYFLSLSAKKY